MERWIERETVFDGRIFRVEKGEAVLDDGTTAQREVVSHPGGVAVVALREGKVLLVRQFRIAINDYLLELPAGKREGMEAPDNRAARELEEETGYRASRLRLMLSYFSSAGFTDERMYIYLASGLFEVGQHLEKDERIEVIAVALEQAQEMITAGQIIDAKTIIGLRELLARPELQAG